MCLMHFNYPNYRKNLEDEQEKLEKDVANYSKIGSGFC